MNEIGLFIGEVAMPNAPKEKPWGKLIPEFCMPYEHPSRHFQARGIREHRETVTDFYLFTTLKISTSPQPTLIKRSLHYNHDGTAEQSWHYMQFRSLGDATEKFEELATNCAWVRMNEVQQLMSAAGIKLPEKPCAATGLV